MDRGTIESAVDEYVVDADERHDEELKRLLRENVMPGSISLSLEREPSFFLASGIEGERHRTLARWNTQRSKLHAMGCRSVGRAYIDGELVYLGYLSQLRIDPDARKKIKTFMAYFSVLLDGRSPDEQRFDITTILSDNEPARRLLGRSLPGMPVYKELGTIETFSISRHRGARANMSNNVQVRKAKPDEAEMIVAFINTHNSSYQYAPYWTVEDLKSNMRTRGLSVEDFYLAFEDGDLVGCLALWDQREFKQVVVRGYEPRLARLRVMNNLFSRLTGVPRLPATGETVEQVFLSHIAINDEREDVLQGLIAAALSDPSRKDFDYATLGFSSKHPFSGFIKQRYRAITTSSILYAVFPSGSESECEIPEQGIPYLDVSVL